MSENKIDGFNKFFKNMNKGIFYLILIIGIVLMVFIGGDEKEREENVKPEKDFETSLEVRLEEIIGTIKGVGAVDVMITYYETAEKNIAYDVRESDKTNHNQNNDKTIDKQAVISDGSPMIVKEVYPKVKGVIVSAEGANDVNIKKNISEAVQAVLDVPAHRVCVYEKN